MNSNTVPVKVPFDAEPLRIARAAKRLSNEQIAEEIKITPIQVSRIMNGQSGGLDTIRAICRLLGVDISDVVDMSMRSATAYRPR